MPTVLNAGTYRDGGSIFATVAAATQTLSFFLQTNHWDHPRDAGHENLFISKGDRPEATETKLTIGSTEERQWLAFLITADPSGLDLWAAELFQTMLKVLQARHPAS
jgi:hypothetical protein